MLTRTITLDQLMSWKPCYDKEKILRLSRGKTEMTIGEILDLRFVSVEEKFWLLLREEIIPARTLHEFALWCAETALTRIGVTNESSWNALKVKRMWLEGKATNEEVSVARDVAWDDARDAAGYVARYAVGYAAMDDARYTAMDAAREAAWAVARYAAKEAAKRAAEDAANYAAWDAARAAAYDAARGEQLSKLREMLESASL